MGRVSLIIGDPMKRPSNARANRPCKGYNAFEIMFCFLELDYLTRISYQCICLWTNVLKSNSSKNFVNFLKILFWNVIFSSNSCESPTKRQCNRCIKYSWYFAQLILSCHMDNYIIPAKFDFKQNVTKINRWPQYCNVSNKGLATDIACMVIVSKSL